MPRSVRESYRRIRRSLFHSLTVRAARLSCTCSGSSRRTRSVPHLKRTTGMRAGVRARTHTYCSLLCSMAVSKLRRIHGIAWVATMCAILAKLYEMRHSIVMELGASAQ